MASIAPEAAAPAVSHNLVGQRLGRKGLETRARIVDATLHLLATDDEPLTLTRVARVAGIGMATLYLYFPDIGDLLLAALGRITEGADRAFLAPLRPRWPDAALGERCGIFIRAYHRFVRRHARILRLRNSCADAGDLRFQRHREDRARPVVELLVRQMDAVAGASSDEDVAFAQVLLAGIEKMAGIVTSASFGAACGASLGADRLIEAQAALLEVAIRDRRRQCGRPGAKPDPT